MAPRVPALQEQAAAAPSRPGGWAQGCRALRRRNFRLFIPGQVVSLVGPWKQNVAQSWLVYRLTHSAWLPGTGSRQKLVLATQTLSMLQAFLLATLTLRGRVQIWYILVSAAALGTTNAFDMPGRQATVMGQMASANTPKEESDCNIGRI